VGERGQKTKRAELSCVPRDETRLYEIIRVPMCHARRVFFISCFGSPPPPPLSLSLCLASSVNFAILVQQRRAGAVEAVPERAFYRYRCAKTLQEIHLRVNLVTCTIN